MRLFNLTTDEILNKLLEVDFMYRDDLIAMGATDDQIDEMIRAGKIAGGFMPDADGKRAKICQHWQKLMGK